MAFVEGLFCTQTVHLGPGYLADIQLAFIRRWLLTEVALYNTPQHNNYEKEMVHKIEQIDSWFFYGVVL